MPHPFPVQERFMLIGQCLNSKVDYFLDLFRSASSHFWCPSGDEIRGSNSWESIEDTTQSELIIRWFIVSLWVRFWAVFLGLETKIVCRDSCGKISGLLRKFLWPRSVKVLRDLWSYSFETDSRELYGTNHVQRIRNISHLASLKV